jgi:hypothetical protein
MDAKSVVNITSSNSKLNGTLSTTCSDRCNPSADRSSFENEDTVHRSKCDAVAEHAYADACPGTLAVNAGVLSKDSEVVHSWSKLRSVLGRDTTILNRKEFSFISLDKAVL